VSVSVEFHPLASDEIADAEEWYERQRSGLGARFLEVVEATANRSSRSPRTGMSVVGRPAGERASPEDVPWVRAPVAPRLPGACEETGIDIHEFQGNGTGGGMFNTAVAPFDDVRGRLGLNKLNDQERVIEALGGTGISLPVTQWFSADSPWWTQEAADSYPVFNFEEGAALLQEYIDDPARSDGKAPGEKIDVEPSCPPDPTLIAAMQVIEQAWSGSELVNVSLTQFDQATRINNAIADSHKAHCWRWSGTRVARPRCGKRCRRFVV